MTPPVDIGVLFASELIEIRDNRCRRHDGALTPETEPMPFTEVCFPRRGLWCRHEAARTLPVDSNHVHFFNAGSSHRVSHPVGCGDRNTGIVMAPATLLQIVADSGAAGTETAPFATTHAPLSSRSYAGHRLLVKLASTPKPDPLAIEETAIELVAATLRAHRDGPTRAERRSHRDLAESARAVLHAELDSPIGVDDVAASVGASPFHLCRVFRRHTGRTMHQYRLQLRLHAAFDRIIEGDEPLAEVAAATGFADRTHLTRQFRRAFGRPPAAFRAAGVAKLSREVSSS